jgi:hypothetical protein
LKNPKSQILDLFQAMELPYCDNWKLLHSLSGERRLCQPAAVMGKLFCVGGFDSVGNSVRPVERIDMELKFDHLGRLTQ